MNTRASSTPLGGQRGGEDSVLEGAHIYIKISFDLLPYFQNNASPSLINLQFTRGFYFLRAQTNSSIMARAAVVPPTSTGAELAVNREDSGRLNDEEL